MLTQEEDDEIANGWPLGLENMNIKLFRVPSEHMIQTTERNSLRVANPSSCFSSFSSSNLDTESSASFFQEYGSVSLGRLIGMRHHGAEREGRLYFPNAIHLPNDHDQRLLLHSEVNNEMEMSCGICVPQLCNVIVLKMSRSKTSPRH